ncbi:hypothetical protein B0O99DRAFT_594006 [Bisporella sp. PMI_857]|nr:hypothetical protein B0O99DRAFT_594006 [Bisporella sp. PMI_857]
MDGLSCASGVAAVVSITFQLAQGIQKLIEFWSAVNDAPERIRDIFDHLRLLSTILHESKNLPMEDGLTKLLIKALSNCEKHVSGLEKKIAYAMRHASSNNRWKRRWADFNITLKDREIRDFQEAIGEAFQLVKGVQISYLMHMTQQNATTTRKILTVVQSLTPPLSVTPRMPHPVQAHVATVPYNNPPPTYEAYYREAPNLVQPPPNYSANNGFTLTKPKPRYNIQQLNTKSKATSYLLCPPELLVRFGISYGLHFTARATAGWQYTLNIFRTIPKTAPIFTFCQDGNTAAVKSLLRDGHASPWDRDPDGRTPLWVASKALNVEIVEYLLSVGADSQARAGKYKTLPLQAANDSCTKNLSKSITTIDLLQEHAQETDEILFELHVPVTMLLHHRPSVHRAYSSALKIIERFLPHLEPGDPNRTRILYAAILLGFNGTVINSIFRYIPNILNETSDTSCLHEAIVKRLFQRDLRCMRLIIQRTKDLHRIFRIHHVMHTPTSLAMCLPDIFYDWRMLLLDIGVEIADFVERELSNEEGLASGGWTQETLTRLFELKFMPQRPNTPSGYPFPSCDRCALPATEVSTTMPVDLEWRRLLREIRSGRFIPGADALHLTPVSEILAQRREWTYKLVCQVTCTDGSCLSKVYENDGTDEPILPPYQGWKTDAEVELEAEEAAREKDGCPTRRMPGAFV